MLTVQPIRVGHSANRLIPRRLDLTDRDCRESAEPLLEVYRTRPGRTRGDAEEEVIETIGDDPTQLVPQGLAKLLEDRCEFAVDSTIEPEHSRTTLLLAAAPAPTPPRLSPP